MSTVNALAREISAKIVYYGPGLSGKTTSLQRVYDFVRPENRGQMISLNTEGDRTLFFDFLPLKIEQVRGLSLRLQLYTVPGQIFYDATRKLVLNGADGVVFVTPEYNHSIPGTVNTWAPASTARSVARRQASAAADGMARITCEAFSDASTSGRLSMPPMTGFPESSRPHLLASSSTRPTTRQSGLRSSSRTSIAPPRPAPTTTTGLPWAINPPYKRCSFHMR